MSIILEETTYMGYARTLHCLKLLKRMHDAGYNVKELAKYFTLHASNLYGWSFEGEPIFLLFDLFKGLFPSITIYDSHGDIEDEKDKQEIFVRMDIPAELKKEINEDSLNTYTIIHIENEDFSKVNFQFNESGDKNSISKRDYHFFTISDDCVPVFHFRDESLSEMIICIDSDYYINEVDTLLEFGLWIKQQLED